jgi:hypothetical protein
MGKKNALGDKPATRRGGAAAAPLSWARLPFATQPLLTTADMAAQRDAVCHISLVPTDIYSLSTTLVLGNLARRRGSRPSQKMNEERFEYMMVSSNLNRQTSRFTNDVVWYTSHSQSCTFVHNIIPPTCLPVIFIILLLVLPYFAVLGLQ